MKIAILSGGGSASVFVARTETAKHTLGWRNVSMVITSFHPANWVQIQSWNTVLE